MNELKKYKWIKEVDFGGSKILKVDWSVIPRPKRDYIEPPAVFLEGKNTEYKKEEKKTTEFAFDDDF